MNPEDWSTGRGGMLCRMLCWMNPEEDGSTERGRGVG